MKHSKSQHDKKQLLQQLASLQMNLQNNRIDYVS